MADRRRSSPSPKDRNTFSNQISSIGAKINRALSGDRLGRFDPDRESLASTVVPDGASNANERSVSRGRQGFSSSGRGGVGNIHQNASTSPTNDYDNVARGRDRDPNPERVISTGRGGIGNIRAPIPEQVVSDSSSANSVPLSSVTTLSGSDAPNDSYSRSRSRGPPLMSTGRGGAGNIRQQPQDTTSTPNDRTRH